MSDKLKIKVSIDFTKIDSDLKKIESKIQNKTIKIDTKGANNSLKQLSQGVNNATFSLKNLGTSILDISQKFAKWYLIAGIVTTAFSSVRDSIEWIHSLDNSVTMMKFTLDGTNETFNDLVDSTTEFAKALGSTVSESIEAVKIYTNMSQSIKSILENSKASVVLSNLGGVSVSINDASNSLQSLQNQFNLLDNQSMHLVDTLTYVSANLRMDFSSGIKEISDGVKLAGSLFNEMGLSAEQSIALMGKMIEITRRSGSSLAAGLRTSFSRIQRVSELGAEDISKLDSAYKSIGINIRKSETEFYNIQEIVSSLTNKWKNLSSVQRSWIAELSAGVRQKSTFLAMMNVWSDSVDLFNNSLEANNFSLERNQMFIESLTGRLNLFKATWQENVQNLVKSDSLKNIVDIGTDLLNVLGKIIGKLGILPPVIFAVSSSIISYRNATISASANTLGLIASINTFGVGLTALSVKARLAAMAVNGVKLAFKTFVPALLITTGISLLTNLISKIVEGRREQENFNNTIDNSKEVFKQNTNNIYKLVAEYEKLYKKSKLTNEETEKFKRIQNELKPILKDSNIDLANTSQNYEELTKKIRETIKAKLEEIDLNNIIARPKAREDIEESIGYSLNLDFNKEEIEKDFSDYNYRILKEINSLEDSVKNYIILKNKIIEGESLTENELGDLQYYTHVLKTHKLLSEDLSNIQENFIKKQNEYKIEREKLNSKLASVDNKNNKEIKKRIDLYKNFFTEYNILKNTGKVIFDEYLKIQSEQNKNIDAFRQDGLNLIKNLKEIEQGSNINLGDKLNISGMQSYMEIIKKAGLDVKTFENILRGFLETPLSKQDNYETQFKNLSEKLESAKSNTESYTDSIEDLAKSYYDLKNGESISLETLDDLIHNYPELVKYINQTNDATFNRGELIKKVAETEHKAMVQSIENELTLLENKKDMLYQTLLTEQKYQELSTGLMSKRLQMSLNHITNSDEMKGINQQIEATKASIKAIKSMGFEDIFKSHNNNSGKKDILVDFDSLFLKEKESIEQLNYEIEKNQSLLENTDSDKEKVKILETLKEKYNELHTALKTLNSAREVELSKIKDKIKSFVEFDKSGRNVVNVTRELKQEENELVKSYQDISDAILDTKLEMLSLNSTQKKNIKTVDELIEKHKELADKAINSYQEHIIDGLEKEIEKYEELKKEAEETAKIKIDNINKEIEKLQEKNDELKEEEERKKRLHDIAKQKEKIANLKKQENVQILQDDGTYKYISDPIELEKETETLRSMEDDFYQWERDIRYQNKIDKKKERIQEIQDELNDDIKKYDKKIDRLQQFIDREKELLDETDDKKITSMQELTETLEGLESESYEERLATFERFIDRYNRIARKMSGVSKISSPSIDSSKSSNKSSNIGSKETGGSIADISDRYKVDLGVAKDMYETNKRLGYEKYHDSGFVGGKAIDPKHEQLVLALKGEAFIAPKHLDEMYKNIFKTPKFSIPTPKFNIPKLNTKSSETKQILNINNLKLDCPNVRDGNDVINVLKQYGRRSLQLQG